MSIDPKQAEQRLLKEEIERIVGEAREAERIIHAATTRVSCFGDFLQRISRQAE